MLRTLPLSFPVLSKHLILSDIFCWMLVLRAAQDCVQNFQNSFYKCILVFSKNGLKLMLETGTDVRNSILFPEKDQV